MSYANPIDTRIVQVVLDDLEDNNAHTVCDLLAAAYSLPWGSIPPHVAEQAYQAAHTVLHDYRMAKMADKVIMCPNHGGAFDCTPFCEKCEGAQEIAYA
jgi:hypothetical protein